MTALAKIGHNSSNLTPFEIISGEISDLYEEAVQWLDGEKIVTTYRPVINDMKLAGRFMWNKYPTRFHDLILQLCEEDVRRGNHSIDGVTINKEQSVR